MSSRSFPALGRLVLGALLLPGALPAEPGWKFPEQVSTGGGLESNDPHFAMGPDGHAHLVWWEAPAGRSDDGPRIVYREHDGTGWSAPVSLSRPGPSPLSPGLAVDSAGQPHVVWVERAEASSMHLVRYTYRPAGGDWLAPVRVSVTERVGYYGQPQIAVLSRSEPSPPGPPEGEVILAWGDDQTMGNPEVFWNRRDASSSAGPPAPGLFDTAQPLSTIDQYHSTDVRLCAMGDRRLAALWFDRRWEGYQALLRLYDGSGWSRETPVGAPAPLIYSNICLVSGGDLIHFLQGLPGGIMLQTADAFLSWNPPVFLPLSDSWPSFCAASIDGERLLVAYRETVRDRGILFAREYFPLRGEFAGVPSVVAEGRQGAISMALGISPGGEPNLAWNDRGPESSRNAVFYSEYRERSIPLFVRGDVDGAGVGLSDAVRVFEGMLGGPRQWPCADAADSNDDGEVDFSDALLLLRFLFLNGSPPPPPFPACGTDPALDALPCDTPACN